MPPTTNIKPSITPEGLAAKNRIAEFRQNIDFGASSADARKIVRGIENPQTIIKSTIPAPVIPPAIPSEALSGNTSIQDVYAKRNQMDRQNKLSEQLRTDYSNLTDRIKAPLSSSPLQNPEEFIKQTLLRQPTQTAQDLSGAQQKQAQGYRDIASGIEQTRQQATEQFALPELQQGYAETQNRIAERTVQLRQEIRDFEINAEKRGIPRVFVEDQKRKVQADAVTELADLSIIASAQQGNIQMAQDSIDRSVEARLQSFQFENAAIETEIKRLAGLDSKEADARKEQLTIALDERKRNIEQNVADEKQRLQYLSEAAANGADQGTLMAIQKSKSPSEAAFLASPFIGRLDRQQKQLDMAVKSEQLAKLRQPTVATLDTEIVEVGGNKQLINSQTGEVIATFGAGTSVDEITQAKDTAFINTLDSLKTHPGLNKAVGTSGLARFTPFKVDTMDGDVSDFTSSVQNVVKQLTLNTFAEAKAKGMTFGAMSEGEWNILGQAATKLVGWTRTRDDGSVYYDTSETNIKKEFDTLSNFGKMSAIRKGTPPEQIGVVTMPDGSYVTRNSDGTYTVLDVTAQ